MPTDGWRYRDSSTNGTEHSRAYPVTPFPPLKKEDPAGADKVVLAAAEAATHWLEAILTTYSRMPIDLWNGPNGLRGVLEEAVKNAGVPNKRFAGIVTPRLIAEKAGIVPARRTRRAK